MKELILIAVSGAIGAVARFLLSGWFQSLITFSFFPLGTWLVNLIGSFFVGFIMYTAEISGVINRELRIFLTIGFLGSFTTFSTFEYESFRLLEDREYFYFLLNSGGGFGVALFSVFLGKIMANFLVR